MGRGLRSSSRKGKPQRLQRKWPAEVFGTCNSTLQLSSSAIATSREGRRSRARSLGTPQQLALPFFFEAVRLPSELSAYLLIA
jgi:hypothetical protein